MLRFEMDVVATDLLERTIEGVIVPYGEVGSIAGREYTFRPGSIELARERTPLLIDHDRGRPVGVLAELFDTPKGAVGRFRIDATADGDSALIQAASGSRGSLSVGAEVVVSHINDGGVIDVVRGHVHEVSLLALGAFRGATVSRVAAEADDPGDDETDEIVVEADEVIVAPPVVDPGQGELIVETEPGSDDDDDDDDDDENAGAAGPNEEGSTMQEASAAPVMILAGAERPREMGAGELVTLMIRAQHGERDAARYLEAALVESISTDVTGLLPPQYAGTVLGGKSVPRVLYNIFKSRPLPGVGLAVNKPQWTTPPDGAWAATVDADATSTKIAIGSGAANIERWDWAGAFPWVVVQRSDPSLIDEVYREAVEDFYLDVETKIAGLLATAAAGTGATLGEGIAEFYTATDRVPDVMIVSPDVWGVLADAGALSNPVAAGGVSTSGGLSSSFGGVPIVASGSLAAGTRILATKRALDARITDPVRLTANAIGALNVELAVVGEGLFDVDYPAEIVALAATPPAALAAQAREATGK